MDIDKMKNMVVLKNLPSNIVDEAIVILKPNIKLKSLDKFDNDKKNKEKNENNENNRNNSIGDNKDNRNKKSNKEFNKYSSKKYIVNEAEMIITNYLSKIENDKKEKIIINNEMKKKYKRLKTTSILLAIISLAAIFFR